MESRLERLSGPRPVLFGRRSRGAGAALFTDLPALQRGQSRHFSVHSAAARPAPPPAPGPPTPTSQELEFARVIVADGQREQARFCTVCGVTLDTDAHAMAHVASKKHKRRRSNLTANQQAGIGDTAAYDLMAAPLVDRVLVVGDCHGGRALALASNLVRSQFCGGTVFSWAVSQQRELPPLRPLLRPPARRDGLPVISRDSKLAFCVFSYGELDVRCHAAKWHRGTPGGARSLATSYVRAAQREVAAVDAYCVAIILAVPPPSDQKDNPRAPFVGRLEDRAAATFALNDALQIACEHTSVLFTGADTFAFARTADSGTLKPDCGDGHVHVRANLCAPVHRELRRLIAQRCGFTFDEPAGHGVSFENGLIDGRRSEG